MDDAESETAPKPTESVPDNSSEVAEDQEEKEEKEEKSRDQTADAQEVGDESKEQSGSRANVVYYSGSALTEAMQQYPETELTITTPLQDGVVKDWAAMEALW
jgi:actin-related protein